MVYGVVLLGAVVVFLGPQVAIVRFEGDESRIKTAVGSNLKGLISPVRYVLGIGCALLRWPFVALAFYVAVALLWLIPDRRIERGFAAVG